MFDKLIDFVRNATEEKEARKYKDLQKEVTPNKDGLFVDRACGMLIEAAQKRADRCREQEKYWTEELEKAEAILREKGITLEVFDAVHQSFTNTNFPGHLCSGGMVGTHQNLQPRVDQRLMDNVRTAKDKMLDYRRRAEGYEKYARVFAVCPEKVIRLSMDDIVYFRLES